MSFTSEPKPDNKELLVKELASLRNILDSVQQNKKCFNAPKLPVLNNYPTHSQNYRAPVLGTFPNNPRPKYINQFAGFPNRPTHVHNKFKTVTRSVPQLPFNSKFQAKSNQLPVFPNRPTHVHNKFSTATRNIPQVPFNSQPQVKSNKFTFIASKATSLTTKSNLSSHYITKPSMVLSNINRPVKKVNDAESKTVLACKLAQLKLALEKTHAKKIVNVTMQKRMPNVNIAQPTENKSFIMPNSVPDRRSPITCDNVLANNKTVSVIPNIFKEEISAEVRLASERTPEGNTIPVNNKTISVIPSICKKEISSEVQLASGRMPGGNTHIDRSFCPLSTTENAVSDSSSTMEYLLTSVENNCTLTTDNNKGVKIDTQNETNKTGSKESNSSSKPLLLLQCKVENKNSALATESKFASNDKSDSLQSLQSRWFKARHDLAVNKARSENAYKNLEKHNTLLLSKKRSPTVKPRKLMNSKFKVVNKNRNTIVKTSPAVLKTRKLALNEYKIVNKNRLPVQTCGKASPALMKTKKITVTKYKIVNKNKSPIQMCGKASPALLKTKKVTSSKYKIVNKNKSPIQMCWKGSPALLKTKNVTLNKYKIVNKNKSPVRTCGKASPAILKTKKVTVNKYKIINKNKSPIQISGVKLGLPSKGMQEFSSKYRIVNAKKASPKMSLEFKVTPANDDGKEDENHDIKPVVNGLLKQKISQLKYIKTTGYEGYDLTDFSPEELVAMDPSSLLQLGAKLKSTKRKKPPLIKMSKYKLVSKESRSKQKAALMVKAKYKNKCRKNSPRSWSANQSSPGSYKGYYYNQFKNGYRKPARSRPSKFRRSLSKYNRYKKTNFAVIGNIRYRVSRTKMTKLSRKSLKHADNKKTARIIIVRGEKFRMDPSGKSLKKLSNGPNKMTLKRIDLGGKTYVSTGHNILTQTTDPRVRGVASRVLNRYIHTAKKKDLKKSNLYCMFFNRFGKCNRGTSCPYSHDPSKIAVCTRFLRGTCKDKNCLFSHEKEPGKMAICSFFLQGLCTNTECPYRHELLSPDAKPCKAFVRGYCSLGMKCKKAHILICPDHFRGHCEKGTSCTYPHPPQPKRKDDDVKPETLPCSEKIHEDNASSNEESSDDEVARYFDSVKSLKSTEASCGKRKKTWSIEQKIKKCKSLHCQPKRDKLLNCPTFIPLSLDEDSS